MTIKFYDISKHNVRERIAVEETSDHWKSQGIMGIEMCSKTDGQFFATPAEAHEALIEVVREEIDESKRHINELKNDGSNEGQSKLLFWINNQSDYEHRLQKLLKQDEPEIVR